MPRQLDPKPLSQHQAKSVILRVPTQSWAQVSTGRVSEFRCSPGNAPQLWKVPLPTLAVAYRRRPASRDYDYRLMLLRALRREALGAITQDGLMAAGYEGEQAFARFRRDWCLHEKRRFEPLRTVFVYTVRLVQPGDLDEVGLALVEHLYGEYLQEAQAGPRTVQVDRRPTKGARRRRTLAGRI